MSEFEIDGCEVPAVDLIIPHQCDPVGSTPVPLVVLRRHVQHYITQTTTNFTSSSAEESFPFRFYFVLFFSKTEEKDFVFLISNFLTTINRLSWRACARRDQRLKGSSKKYGAKKFSSEVKCSMENSVRLFRTLIDGDCEIDCPNHQSRSRVNGVIQKNQKTNRNLIGETV